MKKNDIFRQAAQHEMPDIEQVRKECIEELHTTHSSKRYPAYFAAIAVVTVVVLCMCITPVRSFAADMIEHIQALIDVNNDPKNPLLKEVPSLNTYVEVDLGEKIFEAGTFYFESTETGQKVKAQVYNKDVIYYELQADGEYYPAE